MQQAEQLLLPTSACAWDESDVPLGNRGVRFRWLYEFIAAIDRNVGEEWRRYHSQERAALHFDHVPEPVRPVHPEERLTTRYFIGQFVVPMTRELLAPLYARVPHEHRGKPSVFVSHTWDSYPLAGAHGSLDMVLDHSPDEFVWIDFACYNQHLVSDASIAPDMQSVIADIGSVVFPWTSAPFFTRSWCLWELVCAHLSESKVVVRDQMTRISRKYWSSEAAMRPPQFTSVNDLSATEKTDQESILELLVTTFGSVAQADEYVRSVLPEWQ